LKWLIRRQGREAELQGELQFHLEEEAGELQARGVGCRPAKYEMMVVFPLPLSPAMGQQPGSAVVSWMSKRPGFVQWRS
jgi:hypothetical protein